MVEDKSTVQYGGCSVVSQVTVFLLSCVIFILQTDFVLKRFSSFTKTEGLC